jgi:hypothetical protein
MRAIVGLAAILWLAGAAYGQSCPDADTGVAAKPSVLDGALTYHDELRSWLGLRLDHPECGENEVQLVFAKPEEQRAAETLQDCNVTAIGKLYNGETGYYSANVAMSIESLKPDASCHPKPVKPDAAASGIPPDLRNYQASITVDYRGKGHVRVEVWKDKSREVPLKPWEAYVNYLLNGAADLIYFGCREGFEWRDANQIPKAPREISSESDLNRASALLNDSVSTNVVTFTCEKAAVADNKPKKGADKILPYAN